MVKVLYIARHDMLEYQSDSLLHGLLSLNSGCSVDFLTVGPRQFAKNRFKEPNDPFWYLFNDANQARLNKLYGRGFTLYGRLPARQNLTTTPKTWSKLLGGYYDLVIYGAVRWNATLLPLVSTLYRNRVVIVDGDDSDGYVTVPRTFNGCLFKREIIDVSSRWLPISFAIPVQSIVASVPAKSQQFADVVPWKPGDQSRYVHSSEESYYADYRRSVYGRTRKKGGWDCLRHYEILMNGCIPYFENLDQCPVNTMKTFPKTLVLEAMGMNYSYNNSKANDVVLELIQWTRLNCTTERLARYVLEQCA
jgi:hypothetical protein